MLVETVSIGAVIISDTLCCTVGTGVSLFGIELKRHIMIT